MPEKDLHTIYITCFITITILCTGVRSHCFNGTMGWCAFTCHCQDDAVCDVNGECPNGLCDTSGIVPWSGPGCQIGNVVHAGMSNNCTDGVAQCGSDKVKCCMYGSGFIKLNLQSMHLINKVVIYSPVLPRPVTSTYA